MTGTLDSVPGPHRQRVAVLDHAVGRVDDSCAVHARARACLDGLQPHQHRAAARRDHHVGVLHPRTEARWCRRTSSRRRRRHRRTRPTSGLSGRGAPSAPSLFDHEGRHHVHDQTSPPPRRRSGNLSRRRSRGGRAGSRCASGPGIRPGCARVRAAADGRLTADQVKMHVAVRRRAIAATPKAGPGDADAGQIARALASLTSDATAAADAGVNLDEYRWVSARIAETDPAAASASAQILDALQCRDQPSGVVPAPSDAAPAVSASAEQATAARVASIGVCSTSTGPTSTPCAGRRGPSACVAPVIPDDPHLTATSWRLDNSGPPQTFALSVARPCPICNR